MISRVQVCRTKLLNPFTYNYRRKQNLRLRPSVSNAQSESATVQQTSSIDSSEHATIFASCGRDSIVVCWHPPKPFPYEHTKPLERTEEELRQGDSPLRADLKLKFKASQWVDGAPWSELQNMFFTYKESFYSRHRRTRMAEVSQPPPIDRKGL